jgi:hypothetical protein
MAEIDFFISFAPEDEAWARWVARVLESTGRTTFMLSRDEPAGSDWVHSMASVSDRSERTVILLSPAYFKSPLNEAEWRVAFARDPTGERGTLLPVRIAEVRPAGLLASRVYVDLVGLDEAEATLRLLEAVRQGSPRDTIRPAFPGTPRGQQEDTAGFPELALAPAVKGGGRVFVSYSHRDRKWLDRLLVHLKPLERAGILDVWEDSQIKPGTAWRDEIENALKSAQIAVLLISADFMASDFIADNELPRLLMGAETRGTIIMPVIVSPSRFQHSDTLSDFQAVNTPDMPLSKMPNHRREEFFVGLAGAIEDALASFKNVSPKSYSG